MFRCFDINVDIQGENQCSWKIIIDGDISDIEIKREYASVQDPLNMHRTVWNETILVAEIPNIINEENLIFAPEQEKTPVSILGDKFCEEQTFPCLFPTVKFLHNTPCDISVSQYFNQHFLSDADYIFFAKSVCEQHHMRSSVNFAMHKIKLGALTAGTDKNDLKGTIERFITSDNAA